MYRQNKLKEELDRLREENFRLKTEVTFWKNRADVFQYEIRALRYELQNKELVNKLTTDILLKPISLKIDDDKGE